MLVTVEISGELVACAKVSYAARQEIFRTLEREATRMIEAWHGNTRSEAGASAGG
jgi:hypothetical protein